MTITIRYSCAACGLQRVALEVPAREDAQDVADWMDAASRLAWQDHWRRSPECRPLTLTEMLIPVVGSNRIGGPTVQ